MVIVLSLLLFGSIMAVFFVVTSQPVDDISARLKQLGYTQEGKVISQEEAELAKSFRERVIAPMQERMAGVLGKYTASGQKNLMRKKLVSAGLYQMTVNQYLGKKAMMAIGFPAFLGGLMFFLKMGITKTLIFAGVGFLFGFKFPDIDINGKTKKRQKTVQKGLPDVLDLLCVSVEAGLGFDQAMGKVVEKTKGAIGEEFNRTMQEIRIGKQRRVALKDMSDRVGVEDLSNFISALIQADQLGVSIAKVLRIQSEQMRMRRRQRAEEQAAKAALKMLFPMIFCIFPSMFIVLLGPAILQMTQNQ